jgi:hypothetical protein
MSSLLMHTAAACVFTFDEIRKEKVTPLSSDGRPPAAPSTLSTVVRAPTRSRCSRKPMSFEDVEQGHLADVRRTARTAADSSSDSNTGGSWRSAASCCARAAEVTDADERR